MWDWTGGVEDRYRSRNRYPQCVTEELYTKGTAIFVGKMVRLGEFNIDTVLEDFDELLPVYEYVEFDAEDAVPVLSSDRLFTFNPKRVSKSQTIHSSERVQHARRTKVDSRHKQMQEILKQELEIEGAEVSIENPDGKGGYIDLVARRENAFEFYEIKTQSTLRVVLREAIGQLLEYAYWPKPIRPKRLVVVGEHSPYSDETEFLQILNAELRIPVSYRQIKLSR